MKISDMNEQVAEYLAKRFSWISGVSPFDVMDEAYRDEFRKFAADIIKMIVFPTSYEEEEKTRKFQNQITKEEDLAQARLLAERHGYAVVRKMP